MAENKLDLLCPMCALEVMWDQDRPFICPECGYDGSNSIMHERDRERWCPICGFNDDIGIVAHHVFGGCQVHKLFWIEESGDYFERGRDRLLEDARYFSDRALVEEDERSGQRVIYSAGNPGVTAMLFEDLADAPTEEHWLARSERESNERRSDSTSDPQELMNVFISVLASTIEKQRLSTTDDVNGLLKDRV